MTDRQDNVRNWPDELPELIPFLPFVVAVWSDDTLSGAETALVEVGIDQRALLSPEARTSLATWFDADLPPNARELTTLRRRVTATKIDPEAAQPRSLTELGIAMWEWETAGDQSAGPWDQTESVQALAEAERALGLLGTEVVRRLRGHAAPALTTQPRTGHVDSVRLREYLDRDFRDVRDRVLAILDRPELTFPPGLPYEAHRERVLEAVRILAAEGLGALAYPVATGGSNDPGASIAAFETLAYGDLSVLVKFGVQFGLFGGSIHQLGTERHHREYLSRIGSLDLPGCYAMTETGHGSNVRDLETTATYRHETRELLVNTPSVEAGKDWIGNAARDGQLATVFARLIVGNEDHGVHAVLVPIRDANGEVQPGVRIEDRGLKLGLNGVDNGRIWFDEVRVPAGSLLDRFGTIDQSGEYHSPIASSGRRFFTMLGTLVAGRVSIASASVSAARHGLVIAVRYAAGRRQFGPSGAEETPILHYRAVQRTLMPRLADAYAGHFAVRSLQKHFASATSDASEVEVMAAALKAWTSDNCVATLQACREMCGGQGYLADNQFAALKADTDIFTTFEGANLVLYQLAAKGLLSRYKDEMGGMDLRGALRYLSERAETSVTELNPVTTRRTDPAHLIDPNFHVAALTYREDRLLRSVAARMRFRLRDGMESLDAVNEVQDHLIALARAHAERLAVESFQRGIEEADADLGVILTPLSSLFALSRIEADRGWYLEVGYLEPIKSQAIRHTVNELCTQLAAIAPDLVDAFGIPERLLPELVRYA
jgi:acyl-CoA oxidase